MANHDIQKSRHLLKRLEEEMSFLSTLMAQIESLLSQTQFVSFAIKKTWSEIDHVHKDLKQHTENS